MIRRISLLHGEGLCNKYPSRRCSHVFHQNVHQINRWWHTVKAVITKWKDALSADVTHRLTPGDLNFRCLSVLIRLICKLSFENTSEGVAREIGCDAGRGDEVTWSDPERCEVSRSELEPHELVPCLLPRDPRTRCGANDWFRKGLQLWRRIQRDIYMIITTFILH